MPLDVQLDRADVGLLVVDMQNGFCHPEGTRGKAFGADAVRRPQEIIPNVVAAIGLAHRLDIPVWFTRQVHYADDATRTRRRIPSHLERRGVKLELCRRGTWDAELLDEMKEVRRPEDETVVKHRSSAFYSTTLECELRMRRVQVLVVTGTTTSFCVDSTIRDAYARDFDVVVPAECVADSDDAAHEATLACIDRFHGVVTSLPELTRALGA
ncbi:cysteine hydrolase family protein [Rhizohabitans arisaemae]|uniref:cysteine hydrolase family protein n=1 Tax=Rhizohabitans arisaemae TaxID=2720610 RepID=UPI0024B09180|nr:isochorismatase family cysteine hydrolase [Rhizohabitans arisaemae]